MLETTKYISKWIWLIKVWYIHMAEHDEPKKRLSLH